MKRTQGVYFSANDAVYPWAVAFLNSFRMFNPELRLILIPFNDECEQLLELKDPYRFEVYTDPAFERLEAIGEAFELGHTPTGPFWFRRYAAFWGPLDEFMYLDARQVILADLRPLLEAPRRHGFDFMHYDCALDQVYEPGPFRREMLRQNRARGFNSGRWASQKGLFTIEEFEGLAEGALQVRDQLNPRNTDQAFINYCCDAKPVQYGHFAEVLDGLCQHGWAGQRGTVYRDGDTYRLWDYGGLEHKKRLALLHWAGCERGPMMPEKTRFYEFFLQNRSVTEKASTYLSLLLRSAVRYPFELVRRNRQVNTSYHKAKEATY